MATAPPPWEREGVSMQIDISLIYERTVQSV